MNHILQLLFVIISIHSIRCHVARINDKIVQVDNTNIDDIKIEPVNPHPTVSTSVRIARQIQTNAEFILNAANNYNLGADAARIGIPSPLDGTTAGTSQISTTTARGYNGRTTSIVTTPRNRPGGNNAGENSGGGINNAGGNNAGWGNNKGGSGNAGGNIGGGSNIAGGNNIGWGNNNAGSNNSGGNNGSWANNKGGSNNSGGNNNAGGNNGGGSNNAGGNNNSWGNNNGGSGRAGENIGGGSNIAGGNNIGWGNNNAGSNNSGGNHKAGGTGNYSDGELDDILGNGNNGGSVISSTTPQATLSTQSYEPQRPDGGWHHGRVHGRHGHGQGGRAGFGGW